MIKAALLALLAVPALATHSVKAATAHFQVVSSAEWLDISPTGADLLEPKLSWRFSATVVYDDAASAIGTSADFISGFDTTFFPVLSFESFVDPDLIAVSPNSEIFRAQASPSSISFVTPPPGIQVPENQTFIALSTSRTDLSFSNIFVSGQVERDGIRRFGLDLFPSPTEPIDRTTLASLSALTQIIGLGQPAPISSAGFQLEIGQSSVFGDCTGEPALGGCQVATELANDFYWSAGLPSPSNPLTIPPAPAVPLPASVWMMLAGLAGLGLWSNSRRSRPAA